MSYRIRYGKDGKIRACSWRRIDLRLLITAVLTVGVWLIRVSESPLSAVVKEVLAHEPSTTTEIAVADMAEALAEGEGWYHAVAAWCHAVLFGRG